MTRSHPIRPSVLSRPQKTAQDYQRGRPGARKCKAPRPNSRARVSKVDFTPGFNERAYNCGFDSTVRAWGVESAAYMDPIGPPEWPMLNLVVTPDGLTILTPSTDRTVFDLCLTSLTRTTGTFIQSATPSCLIYRSVARTFSLNTNANEILPSPPSNLSTPQVLTGTYDGVARLWVLRSLKNVAGIKTWDGTTPKKIVSVEWVGKVVGVGGGGVRDGGSIRGIRYHWN